MRFDAFEALKSMDAGLSATQSTWLIHRWMLETRLRKLETWIWQTKLRIERC
jgi:hypothetical protein